MTITNWKYEAFLEEQKDWVYDDPNYTPDQNDYISLNIFPEDLEIMMDLLIPRLFYYKNMVFLCRTDHDKEYIISTMDKKSSTLSDKEKQKVLNMEKLEHVFFDKWYEVSESTAINIAKLIKHNWEYHLQKEYPDRKFIVEIGGETFEPWISFYEVPLK